MDSVEELEKFSDFPDELILLPKLETLIINADALSKIPFELFEMPALKELKITGKNPQKYPLIGYLEKFFKISKKYKFNKNELLKNPNTLFNFIYQKTAYNLQNS